MGRKSRKTSSTSKKQHGPKRPAAVKKESTPTDKKKIEKDDEGWGPIGDVAKKAAKGAVKGAAKDLVK